MIPAVRYLLAVTLVLQFSGVSAAWPQGCAMATAGNEHACCVARRGASVAHLTGSCGCEMTPVPAAPSESVVSSVPEGAADHGAPIAEATDLFTSALSHHPENQEHSPPGSGRPVSLSRLSGSGFRC
jgi:hypothetical protein